MPILHCLCPRPLVPRLRDGFVQSKAPFDLFESKQEREDIKFYVRRVCIVDDSEELMPERPNMVKGVAGSQDWQLNISREALQYGKILRVTQKNLVKRCLEMSVEIAEKKGDYKTFYGQFGKCLEIGVHEDSTDRTKVAELMRFRTSESGNEQISLEECVDRMEEGQHAIYHTAGESITVVSSSPFLTNLRKKGLEVRCMVEPVDEYCVQQFKEFGDKKLKSTAGEDFVHICLDMFAASAAKRDDCKKFYELDRRREAAVRPGVGSEASAAIVHSGIAAHGIPRLSQAEHARLQAAHARPRRSPGHDGSGATQLPELAAHRLARRRPVHRNPWFVKVVCTAIRWSLAVWCSGGPFHLVKNPGLCTCECVAPSVPRAPATRRFSFGEGGRLCLCGRPRSLCGGCGGTEQP